MNRTTAFAILISLAMVGGSFLVVGESQALTPQTGSVTVQITYAGGAVASTSTTSTIKDLSGTTIASVPGPHKTLTLNYGNYYIDVNPLFTSSSTGQIIASHTVQSFTVSSSTMSLPVSVSTTQTYSGYLNVSGITTGTAYVSLQTLGGFTFENFTMTSTSNNVSAYLPGAQYYVNVDYSGNSFTVAKGAVSAAGQTVAVDLGTGTSISGFVTDQTSKTIDNINAVVLNPSNANSYSVFHFTNGAYSLKLSGFTNEYVFISSPGYNTTEFYNPAAGLHDVVLHKVSSSVYYNYSLSADLHTLTMKVTYNIGNNTTIPNYFPHSDVGSFYWQKQIDGITTTVAQTYMANLAQQYTDKTIMVAGDIFNMTGAPTATASVGTDSMTGSVTATYVNTGISSSLGNTGYNVQIYALGTKTTPGSLYYHYNFTYSNPGLSLSSSSSSTSTFKSPILLNPVTSSQWVTLTLKPVKEPAVVDSEINLFWTGITSNNYVLNTSATNTAFIAPNGVPVSLNASNAYFNPVTGTNDYQYATFTWQVVGGSMYTGYNTTITFNAPSTKVILNATSPSGSTNTSTFTVITSTANPSANYSVSLAGKTLSSGPGAPSPVSITVPQSSLVTYSAYLSSLNVSGYSVPLEYHWYMPGYASAAQNITYAFSKPYIATGVGLQTAYLNVSTVFGTYKNVTFSVNVTDTTPPVPSMKLTNAAGSSISQPTAGAPTVFSANTSTDPYYATSQLTYSWAVKYPNGTAVKNGSSTYNVVGGSMTGSYVMLKFNTLSTMVVSLKATNPSNVSAYNNKTVNMIVDTPRIVVNSIYVKDNLTQGSQSTIYINVSNNGTVTANDFSIAILINGNPVASQTYARNLAVGQSANVSFNYTPATSGKVTLVFQANNSSEPAFMAPLGSYTTTLTINAPAYKTPLIIGSIIAVIVIVGLVYYRLSSGKTTKKPKQQPKPKTELKKPAEKKK